MAFWLIMLAALLNHSCFKATKVLMSLFALDLGAALLACGGLLMHGDARRKAVIRGS